MDKQITFNLIIFSVLLIFSSCVREGSTVEDCIRDINVELRWMGTMPVDYDETVTLAIDPVTYTGDSILLSDVYGTTVDLLPGTYRVIGWEDHRNAELDTDNWTVASSSITRAYSDPNIFSAGRATETISTANTSHVIPVPMYRQVRPLVITVNFAGDGLPLVAGLTGTVSNVAMRRSLDSGFPPLNSLDRPAAITGGSVEYTFTRVDDESGAVSYTATRNLLGIDGNYAQMLDLDVSMNESDNCLFTADISEKLTGYHTENINEPWHVSITLSFGADWELSIEDWVAGPESWIVAH